MKYLLIFSAFFTVLHAQIYTCGREKIRIPDEYKSVNNLSERDLTMKKIGQMKLILPQPRETLIDLVPSSQFDPPVISVKRCYGYCGSPRLNYEPSEITKKQIIVNRRSNSTKNGTKEYILIDVDEHVKCSRCLCLKPQDDCVKENKRLNNSTCTCV